MIKTYKYIAFNSGMLDEQIVDLTGKVQLVKGDDVLVFDSLEERQSYIDIQIVFDLDGYKQQVNDAHNALFRKLYTERNYLSIGEIPLWFADPDFGEEAVGLSHWWIDTCNLVSNYLDSVTEETAQPVEQFIQSLPPFTV